MPIVKAAGELAKQKQIAHVQMNSLKLEVEESGDLAIASSITTCWAPTGAGVYLVSKGDVSSIRRSLPSSRDGLNLNEICTGLCGPRCWFSRRSLELRIRT